MKRNNPHRTGMRCQPPKRRVYVDPLRHPDNGQCQKKILQ